MKFEMLKQKTAYSMKSFLYVFAVATFALNFLSCSENEESPIPSSVETRTPASLEARRAANAILVKFMKLDGNECYYLDISREDALKLGVPAEFYDKGLQDIENTNRSLQWYRENQPEINVHVSDPSEWTSDPTPHAAVFSNFPSGTLTTSGQEEAGAAFRAPAAMSGVSFFCRANAVLGCTYTCKTYSLGNWRTEVGTGTSFSNTYNY